MAGQTSGSGSRYQCIVDAAIINCNIIVNKTKYSVLCVVLEDEARLDQFPRPVVAQQYPRMMPSEEWHWPLARPRGHLVEGDSRQELEEVEECPATVHSL